MVMMMMMTRTVNLCSGLCKKNVFTVYCFVFGRQHQQLKIVIVTVLPNLAQQ